MGSPKYIRTDLQLNSMAIQVYASPKVAETFREVSVDMNLYKGVKLFQLLEAVYVQGKKDGARGVFEQVDVLKDHISHRNPGKPAKRKKS